MGPYYQLSELQPYQPLMKFPMMLLEREAKHSTEIRVLNSSAHIFS